MSVYSSQVAVNFSSYPESSIPWGHQKDVQFPDYRLSNEELLFSLQCSCDHSYGVREAVEASMFKLLKLLVGKSQRTEVVALGCPDWSLVCGSVDFSKEMILLAREGVTKAFIQGENNQLRIHCITPLSKNEIKSLFVASNNRSDLHELPGGGWERFKKSLPTQKSADNEIVFKLWAPADGSLNQMNSMVQGFEFETSEPLPASFTAKMLQIFYKYG